MSDHRRFDTEIGSQFDCGGSDQIMHLDVEQNKADIREEVCQETLPGLQFSQEFKAVLQVTPTLAY